MLTEYIQAAMREATYELLNEGEDVFYGHVPALQGVWATGKTLEACRKELQDVLEGWLLVRLSHGQDIPLLGGLDLNVKRAV